MAITRTSKRLLPSKVLMAMSTAPIRKALTLTTNSGTDVDAAISRVPTKVVWRYRPAR